MSQSARNTSPNAWRVVLVSIVLGVALMPCRAEAGVVPGDVNADGQVNVQDVFYLINFLFAGGPAPVLAEITVTLPGGVPLVLERIPAGTFQMGSPAGERNREVDETLHQVTLTHDYYLGKTEVTQAQWQAVMGTPMPDTCGSYGVGDGYPVYCVSWVDIAGPGGFVEKLNVLLATTKFRLPTEAEWERAARAGTTTRFAHGDGLECADDCSSCALHAQNMWWCGNNTPEGNKPVGGKQPNAYGLYDMHGSLWELVQDFYGDYPPGAAEDPPGPASGDARVMRGGSWDKWASSCRAAYRGSRTPTHRGNFYGFRLARSL
ncbi:MAG TPA: SUMF1/EgtB/PvdO family nonheme iron enzyme [Thermoanaerobaculaceae bacterium]|nr:SUMF1/EgtB/PvdO family nonheme iron enzyme [Thermoanaerobaculaceae bacterium]HPS77438.1 SUMF1/EgtB/PvdO family nonheme iron enzyme [Thermoanaerobaculaceae bacterium]